MADIFEHLAALAYPLPTRPEQVDPPEAFDDAVAEIRERQTDYLDNLRTAWEAEDFDPLLGEIENIRAQREAADRRLRQLVAYGREFISPRPYPLAALAEAAGLGSHSSARTFYGDNEIAAVAAATGAKPVSRPRVTNESIDAAIAQSKELLAHEMGISPRELDRRLDRKRHAPTSKAEEDQ